LQGVCIGGEVPQACEEPEEPLCSRRWGWWWCGKAGNEVETKVVI
jgi:hypothetical protein